MSLGFNLCIEANKIIPEDRFEATGDIGFGRTGAPKKSRANRNDGKVKSIISFFPQLIMLAHSSFFASRSRKDYLRDFGQDLSMMTRSHVDIKSMFELVVEPL